jgi:hypothetical protein
MWFDLSLLLWKSRWYKMDNGKTKMTEQTRNPNEEALMEVDWIMQESFKRAVKLRSITDWSDFKTPELLDKATREVEQYQLAIAKLISDVLKEKQRQIENKKRDEKWDAQDKKFEKQMIDSDEKFFDRYDKRNEKIGFRKDKDDTLDDRGTDEIGKP